MGRIAVEIIPRDAASLQADIEVIKKYPQVDCVNIPDLMSFELKSWQAARITQPALPTIPHVRAMDIDLSKPLPMNQRGSDNRGRPAERFNAHSLSDRDH